jgi:hypothetical protein
MSDRVQIASVRSEGAHQSGEKHRSSGNFSTDNTPDGYQQFEWEVSETEQPGNVKFNVMEDKSAHSDPVIFEQLTNSSTTDIVKSRRLYIADPSGSNGGSFLVTVWALRD